MKLKLLFPLIIFLAIPTLAFTEKPSEPKIEEKPVDVRLEVVKAKLTGKGYFVDIQFRIHGEFGNHSILLHYPRNIYVIEESTGEKFVARRFARIGALGQKRLDEGVILFVRIDNAGGKIKRDSRITLVVGKFRQEHIVVDA